MTHSNASPTRRSINPLLLVLAAVGMAAFHALSWIEGNGLLLEKLLIGEYNGWDLLDWAQTNDVAIVTPLWAALVSVPVAGIIALVRILGRNNPAVQQKSKALGWVGFFAAMINLVSLLFVFVNVRNEMVALGLWLALASGAGLAAGFFYNAVNSPTSAPALAVRKPAGGAAPAGPPGNARLLVHSGWMEGARPRIAETPFTIGRQEQNTLVLFDDLTVSRQHAVILYSNGIYFLRAVSPDKPVWVGKDAQHLRPELSWRLESHDFFAVGESLIEFVIE